ncbi:hypothetical protein PoB_005453000 [Plakobranchus ocellatus]|uniref:Uncharacterized protein n=1 Tax=Plakobranchus ocellatus TaxID=259542 RepID=A0AAV4C8M5_9GAST|nr:hypothetical protein PoB_005453000 [Plakobranchus ocellatus]
MKASVMSIIQMEVDVTVPMGGVSTVKGAGPRQSLTFPTWRLMRTINRGRGSPARLVTGSKLMGSQAAYDPGLRQLLARSCLKQHQKPRHQHTTTTSVSEITMDTAKILDAWALLKILFLYLEQSGQGLPRCAIAQCKVLDMVFIDCSNES